MEGELKKLKAARAKDATRWKGTALKAKEKALAEQQRAHNICTAELGKEVEALKSSKSLVEKEVVRRTRRVDQLEKELAAGEWKTQQGSKDLRWLQTQHESAKVDMAVLKKEHETSKKELADHRRNVDNMKQRHKDKVAKLTAEMIGWRDSHLSQVMSTKVHKGKHAPFNEDFEHCSRGMLATGVGAEVCVDAFHRGSDFILPPGKAREEFIMPQKRWFSNLRESVGHVAWTHAAIEMSEAEYILQFGHDETQIMRQGTMNLWALMWGKNKKLKIVTMEAAGLLVGGASREIAHHIKTQFGRMQAAA
jgi:hypothetical protein